MGGFHSYHDGKPTFPLQVERVSVSDRMRAEENKMYYIVDLVKSRSLVPPTVDELGDRSKGDSLSKTIAVTQTLWFVVQCIARRAQDLATTNLEIVTLAYTVITVAMYAAWWHKPLGVRCPVRVKGGKRIGDSGFVDVIDYITGDGDYVVNLRAEERVPTFWSSCSSRSKNKIPLYADIAALSVAMAFGAVHCAAWSYAFPSLQEKWIWRACAIAITAIPLPMAAMFAAFDPFGGSFSDAVNYLQSIVLSLCGVLYIVCRIVLLALSFTTLRHLPPSAYQTVQWTTWIPHI